MSTNTKIQLVWPHSGMHNFNHICSGMEAAATVETSNMTITKLCDSANILTVRFQQQAKNSGKQCDCENIREEWYSLDKGLTANVVDKFREVT